MTVTNIRKHAKVTNRHQHNLTQRALPQQHSAEYSEFIQTNNQINALLRRMRREMQERDLRFKQVEERDRLLNIRIEKVMERSRMILPNGEEIFKEYQERFGKETKQEVRENNQ